MGSESMGVWQHGRSGQGRGDAAYVVMINPEQGQFAAIRGREKCQE